MRVMAFLVLASTVLAQPCPEVGDTIELTAPALAERFEGADFVTRALMSGEQREVLELVTENGRQQARLKDGYCWCDELKWEVVARPIKRPHAQVMRITGGAARVAPRTVKPAVRPVPPVKRVPKKGNLMVGLIEYERGEGKGPEGSWIPLNWDRPDEPPGGPPVLGLIWSKPVANGRRGTWRKKP